MRIGTGVVKVVVYSKCSKKLSCMEFGSNFCNTSWVKTVVLVMRDVYPGTGIWGRKLCFATPL
ncbi:MAG: hypothetical protein OXC42_02745 [Gammaproteobacteria bacterium]|nr:hypothetical protein [Gammaproteobacteria bacterium]